MHLWHRWVPVENFGTLPKIAFWWLPFLEYVSWTDYEVIGLECSVCRKKKLMQGFYSEKRTENAKEANAWLNSAPKPSRPPIKLKTSSQDREAWRELEEPLDFGHQDLMNLLDDVETLLKRVEEG